MPQAELIIIESSHIRRRKPEMAAFCVPTHFAVRPAAVTGVI
jgi:hypothetical protein